MDPRMDALRQWWTAQSDREATEAVIALAVEEVKARRRSDRDGYEEEEETGETE